jgi:hypothetical protein
MLIYVRAYVLANGVDPEHLCMHILKHISTHADTYVHTYWKQNDKWRQSENARAVEQRARRGAYKAGTAAKRDRFHLLNAQMNIMAY